MTSPRAEQEDIVERLRDYFAEIESCIASVQGALRHYQQPQDVHFHMALKACRDGADLLRRAEQSGLSEGALTPRDAPPAEVIEAVAGAIDNAHVFIERGVERSLGYYASVGMDYLKHPNQIQRILSTAAAAAIEAYQKVTVGDPRGEANPQPQPPQGREQGELKPCPFCGDGNPFLMVRGMSFGKNYQVICHGCKNRTDRFDARIPAITAWNRRTQGRESVIEECAAVADKHAADWHIGSNVSTGIRKVAKAIRALDQSRSVSPKGSVREDLDVARAEDSAPHPHVPASKER